MASRRLTAALLLAGVAALLGGAAVGSAAVPRAPLFGSAPPPERLLLDDPLAPRDKHAKLESSLVATAREAREDGTPAALSLARRRDLDVVARRVRVVIEVRGDRSEVRAAVAVEGGETEEQYENLIQALLPPSALGVLSRRTDVRLVRPPFESVPAAVPGEGVGVTGASAWQARGQDGAGVKVAIIDGGFAGLAASKGRGDLPTSTTNANACASGFSNTDHGTAVAEIVHEIAPAAQLYLVCAGTEVELGAAKDYVVSQGVHIVNRSAGSFATARGDGTSAPGGSNATVADARARGILWVNATGNHAQKHWSGNFGDSDGDNFHNFAPGDEGNTFTISGGGVGCAALRWDDWPASSQDYELYLARSSDGVIVQGSEGPQTGSEAPVERLCYQNTGPTQAFEAAIFRYSATRVPSPRFDLFVFGQGEGPLQYQVPEGSLGEPADSPSALSAGAICWRNDSLEPYSSRGPTVDGRLKPDLAGQDSVSSGVYGPFSSCGTSGFPGTSAAAPHVAGAAALVKQTNPGMGPAALQSTLEGRAGDLGPPGKDSLFGSGKLLLGPPPAQCSDGRDNDRDGRTDVGQDPGCASAADDSESPDPPPPTSTTPATGGAPSRAALRARAIRQCKRKYRGKRKARKRAACVKRAKRRYR